MPDLSTPQMSTSPVSLTDDWQKFEPLHRRVADYFNVDVNTEWSHQKPKVDYLIEWAEKATASEDPEKILLALYELENRVGKPSLEDKRLNHLYRSLRLDSQGNLQKEIQVDNIIEEIHSTIKDKLRKILGIGQ